MLKISIKTLVPIRRDPKKRNYLKPGEYEAEVNRGGTLSIHTKYGDYVPLPGQFKTIEAPREYTDYWFATLALIEAQENYRRSNNYQMVTTLQSVQGKYETAKRNFEKLFIEKEDT